MDFDQHGSCEVQFYFGSRIGLEEDVMVEANRRSDGRGQMEDRIHNCISDFIFER